MLIMLSKLNAAIIEISEATAMITRTQFPIPSMPRMVIPKRISYWIKLNYYGLRICIFKLVSKICFCCVMGNLVFKLTMLNFVYCVIRVYRQVSSDGS